MTRVNGVTAWPGLILRDGDRLESVLYPNSSRQSLTGFSNTVHRHEPPITNDPILVLHIDREKKFIVISKPGSMVSLSPCPLSLILGGEGIDGTACTCYWPVFPPYSPGSDGVRLRNKMLRYVTTPQPTSDSTHLMHSAVNRLDRLTSGLMIMALSGPASRDLAQEFADGTVKKQYVARVKGRFPESVVRAIHWWMA